MPTDHPIRFAGQDEAQADVVSESVGTLSEGKSLWQCTVWCLSDADPICASYGASYASSHTAQPRATLRLLEKHTAAASVALMSEGGRHFTKQQKRAGSSSCSRQTASSSRPSLKR